MIIQNRYPEAPTHGVIPWHTFVNPQDAYEWTKAHVEGFYYNLHVDLESRLYVNAEETREGKSFYTDFMDTSGEVEVLRLWVKP